MRLCCYVLVLDPMKRFFRERHPGEVQDVAARLILFECLFTMEPSHSKLAYVRIRRRGEERDRMCFSMDAPAFEHDEPC